MAYTPCKRRPKPRCHGWPHLANVALDPLSAQQADYGVRHSADCEMAVLHASGCHHRHPGDRTPSGSRSAPPPSLDAKIWPASVASRRALVENQLQHTTGMLGVGATPFDEFRDGRSVLGVFERVADRQPSTLEANRAAYALWINIGVPCIVALFADCRS